MMIPEVIPEPQREEVVEQETSQPIEAAEEEPAPI